MKINWRVWKQVKLNETRSQEAGDIKQEIHPRDKAMHVVVRWSSDDNIKSKLKLSQVFRPTRHIRHHIRDGFLRIK